MTIAVANVNLANTFSHWLTRTNELAQAMSFNCVTVGGSAAVGNAEVHGVFSANTIRVDAVTGYSSGNVSIESAQFIIANTASVTSIGALNVNGQLNINAIATVKIQGSNTTHRVVSVVDANGTLGFVQVAFPIDQLTDVDTSNIAVKDNETIIKWNANTGQWTANTLSLINSTRINTLNVGTVTSTLTVTANVNVSNNTLFVNGVNRRVGIGMNNPAAALSVNGAITATGDISSFQTSDATFKDNILTIDTQDALQKILELEVVGFDWNEEAVKKSAYASPENSGHDVGLIAQQVSKVIPGAVIKRPDGTLALNYQKIIPYLIAAVQRPYRKT